MDSARIEAMANLLGIETRHVRETLARARRAYPNETEEGWMSIVSETLCRENQQEALKHARKSVGR